MGTGYMMNKRGTLQLQLWGKVRIDEKKMEQMEQVFNKEKTLDNALNVFLCNDYFKKEFSNVSENVKEYLKVSYFTSLISENYAKQHEKQIDKMFADAESKMTKKDWQYLEDTTQNQQAKYSYRMKKEKAAE